MFQYPAFKTGKWVETIDVRDFIQTNYTPYDGSASFLTKPTERTAKINAKYEELHKQEFEKGGVLDVDTDNAASLLTHKAGYLDKEHELIVGLQTDAPLKRAINPFGGMRMAEQAAESYGYQMSDTLKHEFTYRTTHNEGVFRAYTAEMRALRSAHVLTGLPDAYGRGRIIGDYRRVALYGIDRLVAEKQKDLDAIGTAPDAIMTDETIRLREDVWRQIDFLERLQKMAEMYGKDISKPAVTAQEAAQAIYFAYLAAIKEQNGAAMSLGRTSTFLDIYLNRDLQAGVLTEETAQELVDDYVLHLRMNRQLRTPEYNDIFAGDPTWTTESLGGMGQDGRTLVTKTSFRMLHTLENLGSAPEPNMTVLWAQKLPQGWKNYCAHVSIVTDSVQYENDDLMRERFGDDYAIACCVSAMTLGKDMQFFGARANLPKVLLMALNGGREEIKGTQVAPVSDLPPAGPLDYEDVMARYKTLIAWLAHQYVNTMNVIHYMHDKYAYEKLQMALHDTHLAHRWMAFGAAGISVAADSLSAIKYAKVTPVRNADGIITRFTIDGDFPTFGNDDDRVDAIAKELAEYFYAELKKTPCYRDAEHTLSLLTITSNVMYGRNTGDTPDGRKSGEPFAPGANPMHGRDASGATFSLNSVAKLNYDACRDGISNTFTINPMALGKEETEQVQKLTRLMDGYFVQGAHHLNVNVFSTDLLRDAQAHPEKYPSLTIRVSGYAVRFINLSKKHQDEVIARTCHSCL
ncbi:MAG: formate C-acetyltransferase [Kiritimatiellia bacterium]